MNHKMNTPALSQRVRRVSNPASPLSLVFAATLLSFLAFVPDLWGQVYLWTTIAGTATPGSADGTNSAASFKEPVGLALDSAGNIYVTDRGNHTIRKIVHSGSEWVVSTIAGTVGVSGISDGTNAGAWFMSPTGIAVDSDGSVYTADIDVNNIRQLRMLGTNWVVKTIAGVPGQFGNHDGLGQYATFLEPNGISVAGTGKLILASGANVTIRTINYLGTNWVVTTIAGSGQGGSLDGTNRTAQFSYTSGVAPDNGGNFYVTDQDNCTIRRLAPDGTNWVVSTISGLARTGGSADGTNNDARFWYPGGLAVDSATNLYIADLDNNAIRKITPSGTNWVVSTIGGICGWTNYGLVDGNGGAARFNGPNGVALDGRGNLYVADYSNNAIRRGTPLPLSQAPTLANGTLTLSWNVALEQVLQVQYATNLSQANWINLGDQFVSTNSVITAVEPMSSVPQRFYRVLVIP